MFKSALGCVFTRSLLISFFERRLESVMSFHTKSCNVYLSTITLVDCNILTSAAHEESMTDHALTLEMWNGYNGAVA